MTQQQLSQGYSAQKQAGASFTQITQDSVIPILPVTEGHAKLGEISFLFKN